MFFLFAGDDYYPCTPRGDYVGAFPTVSAAQERVRVGSGEQFIDCEWAQIATVRDGALVFVAEFGTREMSGAPFPGDWWQCWTYEGGAVERVQRLTRQTIEAETGNP